MLKEGMSVFADRAEGHSITLRLAKCSKTQITKSRVSRSLGTKSGVAIVFLKTLFLAFFDFLLSFDPTVCF